MTFKSAPELSNYLNMRIRARQYLNNETLVCFNRYLISRTRENLAEKIKTYYCHCDPNGVYHVEYPSDDIIRDFFKGISKDDFVDKYNMGEATFYKYRKWFNISFFHLTEDIREYILSNSETVSENDLFDKYGLNKRLAASYIETTLNDGWSFIERQKSLGTYEDSRDLFMYASRREITIYDYFLKRLACSAEDIKDAYGLDRKTMIEFEKFNELNYDRLKSLYIDEKYPYNYWVCHEEMLNDIIMDMWLGK